MGEVMGLILFFLIIAIILGIIGSIKSYQNSEKISSLKWDLNKLKNQIKSLEQLISQSSNSEACFH